MSKAFAISVGVTVVSGLILGGVVGSTANVKTNRPVTDDKQIIKEEKPSEYTTTKTETKTIEYKTKTVDDKNLEYGTKKVRTEGKNGVKTITYEVKYKDGKEVSRKKVKEEVTKKAVTKVIAKGTKVIWRCVDVTSYDRNPYNDNRCVNSKGAVRYVPDSTARSLDPTYYPGQSGAAYYNRF